VKCTETTRSLQASQNESTQIVGAMSRRNLLLSGSTLAAALMPKMTRMWAS
jgi:hypothetical protein